MKSIYSISGMTCNGCRIGVEEKLSQLDEVTEVVVDLEKAEAVITSDTSIPLVKLQGALPSKYQINTKKAEDPYVLAAQPSKLKQLQPLLIIFGYIIIASVLLNYKAWETSEAMLDFMGLFYIVFSFFKILDLKGFPKSFAMYDPLAKSIPAYGWIYPFIEAGLGLLFLMRLYIPVALVITLIILPLTTFGVLKVLMDKKSIQCACLGTAIKLPMTEATLIENVIMIVMAILMLIQTV